MNRYVHDWGMEDDLRSFHSLLPPTNQKKLMTPDNGLVELFWRDGHVIMQSQNNRKPPPIEFRQAQKFESQLKHVTPPTNPSNLMQEDETASWFQSSLDDSFGKEFGSAYLTEMPMANANNNNNNTNTTTNNNNSNKPSKKAMWALEDGNAFAMPPPKTHGSRVASRSGNVGGPVNFSHFARPMKNDTKLKLGSRMVQGVGESSSIRTVGSSACGSNQVLNQADASHTLSNSATDVLGKGVKDDGPMISPSKGPQTNTLDATMTTSSGGSGCSFGRITGHHSASNQNEKRKGRDGEESECRSEEAEYESVEADRSGKRPTSTRKSRAAEVHNLSERRRRDRINEKMKALQELIPHCNKSDKASMLDEAIEYLKSLQLQLQLMWMGSGMAPIMFPGVQQCMPRVSMGMGHASMPSMNNPIQLLGAPLVNQSMPSTPPTNQMPVCAPPAVNPLNFTTQVQNVHLSEPYAQYFGFPHMQPAPQAMNLYAYGYHMVQQNQTAGVAGSSSLPTAGIPSGNIQNGQSGKSAAMGTFTFY